MKKIYAMKTLKYIAMMLFAAISLSCTVVGSTTRTGYVDDMYGVVSRSEINRAVVEKQLAEERAEREMQEIERNALGYESELVDGYEDSYERRLRGFSSSNYRMPSSTATYSYIDIAWYTKIYDPAFYNIIISGGNVWVEPKYITAMFGNWGASVVIGTSWGSPYWNHWSSYCYYTPWYATSYWWRPNHYHWAYHHPRYNFHSGHGPRHPIYRPNVPSRPTTPIYYGSRRVNNMGNITNSQVRRQSNQYAVPNNRSFSREIEANRNVNVVEQSGYSTAELINRRRENSRQARENVESRSTRNLQQNRSNAYNQANRNQGSSAGSANRGNSGGGVTC